MPTRTCVGCHRTDEKGEMLRVVKTDQGGQVDGRQRLPGRGAYVHRRRECIERARGRAGLARSFKSKPANDEIFQVLLDLAQA